MWIQNMVFSAIGIWLYRGMGNERSTGRGGGMDEFLWKIRDRMSGLFRRRARRAEATPGQL
jgi:hypothetical protein